MFDWFDMFKETKPIFNGEKWLCEQCRSWIGWEDILAARRYKYCPNCGRRIVWEDKGNASD